MLQIVDPEFPRDQYARARRHLARKILGFGVAREWPPGLPARQDIDSGIVIPVIDASAGSSGLAVLAAAAFGDETFLRPLLRSLEIAGFPSRDEGRLR